MVKLYLYDDRLSLRSKAILDIIVLLKKEHRKVTIDSIQSCCSEKFTAVVAGISQLETFGYLSRIKTHENGRYIWEYTVDENGRL